MIDYPSASDGEDDVSRQHPFRLGLSSGGHHGSVASRIVGQLDAHRTLQKKKRKGKGKRIFQKKKKVWFENHTRSNPYSMYVNIHPPFHHSTEQ